MEKIKSADKITPANVFSDMKRRLPKMMPPLIETIMANEAPAKAARDPATNSIAESMTNATIMHISFILWRHRCSKMR